ncbi:DUF2760 domain-containing protein [Massilia antarctica]|uniref:DUF2760 domain-containing protein n=1 Tax=Massilia antarctica TaxID=2765360 RepID=UPI0006BB69FE|nr:DUF2760 domain-containing protein [Massilia sp. H27-R4]MCY0916129.1 DUF2760 domain-containing protein [Massilia sp. H27-R4]CUI05968.1 FIG00454163: hypothetical protein [Janthinobacterium sp. CG23_2]CUU29754.1 FIG00454163: hypothetical protein [Janthinobacterium sp. CG23_2]
MIDSSPNSNHPSPDNNPPSFLRRIPIAFGAFFGALSDAGFAGRIERVRDGMPVPTPAPVPAAPVTAPAPAPKPAAPTPDTALQLLSLFQRDARLIDFTQENLSGFSDADIGAAARVVHEGCAKVLREHFTIVPVRDEAEGSRITLNDGFDARAVRLTGNVVGKAPFNGSISHRGWRAAEVRLPTLAAGHDTTVLAQAEVEL